MSHPSQKPRKLRITLTLTMKEPGVSRTGLCHALQSVLLDPVTIAKSRLQGYEYINVVAHDYERKVAAELWRRTRARRSK